MEQTKLVAGHEGIDNQIKWVTVVEVLEDIERLQKGEFLITTGFKLLEDKERLEIFHKLLQNGTLSGVAIYTTFYLDEIPKSFIDIANAHDLPLIEIPVDINFSEITRAILQQIINKQAHLLAHSETIHHELSSLILNDQKLSEVTKRLAELTSSKIMIYDEFYHVIYDNEDFFEAENIQNNDDTFFINGRKIDMTKHLLRSLEKEAKENITIEQYLITIYPIIAKQSCFGWIVMWKKSSDWQELDDIAIERAATIYAMEFLKKQAVEETKLRIQSNLLDDILNQNYTNEKIVIDQALKFNYDLSLPQSVYHLMFKQSNHINIHLFDRLYHMTEQLLSQKNKQLLIQTKLNSIIFLTNVQGKTKLEQKKQAILLAKELLEAWDYYFPKNELIIGIGNVYEQIQELGESAREAQYAATLSNLVTESNHIIHYDDLGMYDLLLKMRQNGMKLSTIYEDHLSGLLSEPNKEVDLIETVDVYFKSNLSIQRAAEKLFIHRHTLRYRLNQIEQRTGLHLKSTDDLLKLKLGVMAYKLAKALEENKRL